MFSSVFRGFIEGIIYATAITFIMSLFFTYAPDIEFKYFPVIKDFTATLVSQEENYRIYDIAFNKVKSCEIDVPSISWYFTNEYNQIERVPVELPRRSGDPTRPLGLNVSKGWHIMIPKNAKVKDETFIVYHYCHPGWRSRTEVMIRK